MEALREVAGSAVTAASVAGLSSGEVFREV